MGVEELPSIPVITNPKAIKRNTRLIVTEDAELTKINEKIAKDKADELAKAGKKKPGKSPEGEKPAKVTKTG